jgi:predicted GNAT family N-acyltransferase
VYEGFGFYATGPRAEKDGIAFIPMKMELERDRG